MRRHLTFANVASALALFLALGGGAYAVGTKLKANSVGSKQVRPDSLTGADIREHSLAQVPSAAGAGDAQRLNGLDSAAFARRGLDWTPVDMPHQSGNPPGRFTCFGSDGVMCDSFFADAPGGAPVAFSRDGFGIVRLHGQTVFEHHTPGPVSPGPILTLPSGHRPAQITILLVPRDDGEPRRLQIEPGGEVELLDPVEDGDSYSLDGVDFACGPVGVAGCP